MESKNKKALNKCWSCEVQIGGIYSIPRKNTDIGNEANCDIEELTKNISRITKYRIEQNLYAKEVKRVYILRGIRSSYNIDQVEICSWCCNLLDKEGFIIKQLSWNNVALLVKDGIIFVMTNNRFEKLIQHKSVEFLQSELMALIKA